jgi:KDO2-lipid IV(A) lauroyltransferase
VPTRLLALVALLPLPLWHLLGGALGVVLLLFQPRQRRRMRDNLAQAGLDRGARFRLRCAWEYGKGLIEMPVLWARPLPSVVRLFREVRGYEAIERGLASGRGILLLTAHLGGFEALILYAAARFPITAMYRPPREKWVEDWMVAGRGRGLARMAATDRRGVRDVLAALRRGEAVGLLPDQVASKGEGVWAPFFGRMAYSPALPARLIASAGALPIVAFAERLPWGRGYRMRIEPLRIAEGASPEALTEAINASVEAAIRRVPAQYFWTYNRYKRPGGAMPPEGST